jgi:hypothetical protein
MPLDQVKGNKKILRLDGGLVRRAKVALSIRGGACAKWVRQCAF